MRPVRVALMAALMGAAWSASARAQQPAQAPEQPPPEASSKQEAPQVTPEQGFGSITGTVSKVDAKKGQLTLKNKGRTATLLGTPDQLANFKPGQEVTLDFVDYNSVHWISLDSVAIGGTGGAEERPKQEARGVVSKLEKGQGSFAVGGKAFRTRPEYLANVNEGDRVQLEYSRISGSNWAASIEVADAGEKNVGGSGEGMEEPAP